MICKSVCKNLEDLNFNLEGRHKLFVALRLAHLWRKYKKKKEQKKAEKKKKKEPSHGNLA